MNIVWRVGRAVKQRGIRRLLKQLIQRRVKDYPLYRKAVINRRGLEIGGPSPVFMRTNFVEIYPWVSSLDNVQFATDTMWGPVDNSFAFDAHKAPGKQFLMEGSSLTVEDASYDFVLSSHSLEHMANPLKAIYEWKRVLRLGGHLVLVLPDGRRTFDHMRPITPIDHMVADFNNEMDESDETHFLEVIEKHDLSWHGSDPVEHQKTVLDNARLRCVHHHVFDERNSRALLEYAGLNVISVGLGEPFHIVLLARK